MSIACVRRIAWVALWRGLLSAACAWRVLREGRRTSVHSLCEAGGLAACADDVAQDPQLRRSCSHRAVLLNWGRTANPVCPVQRHCGAFPHCEIVVQIVGLDHESLLQCLWAELWHVNLRYLLNGNSLTAVNKPMQEQM